MFKIKLAAALLAAFIIQPAFAASYGNASDIASAGGISWTAALPETGYDFSDSFTFTLGSASGAQTRFEASFYDWSGIYNNPDFGQLSLPQITFSLNSQDNSSMATAVMPGLSGTAQAAAVFSGLSSGNTYTLTVTGTGVGDNTGYGSYYLGNQYTVAVAAVPEPETYALLLAGLGLLGGVTRRRTQQRQA